MNDHTRDMTPVFIGGTGRSGTSVLKDVLDADPNVIPVPHEFRFITDPGGLLDLIEALSDSWSPFTADRALREFRNLTRRLGATIWTQSLPGRLTRRALLAVGVAPWSYRSLDLTLFGGREKFMVEVDSLIASLTTTQKGFWLGSDGWQARSRIYASQPASREDVARAVCEWLTSLIAVGATRHHSIWVEDTPYNLLYADKLLEVFPGMRLIHIYRDPRDVVASHLTKPWAGNDETAVARRIVAIHRRWRAVRRRLPQDTYREVSLEQLVSPGTEELSRLRSFLGLGEPSPANQLSVSASHSGRWRRDLSPEIRRTVVGILTPLLVELEYEQSGFL